jgi:hypothetical protein
MADTLKFSEGLTEIGTNGLPATVYFLLSTKDCATLLASDTLSGGVGEITGTGYARQSEARPTGAAGVFAFAAKVWATLTHTDWPASVKSSVAATTANNTGKALCAWNLQAGGTARDLSGAQTTETFTPTITVA